MLSLTWKEQINSSVSLYFCLPDGLAVYPLCTDKISNSMVSLRGVVTVFLYTEWDSGGWGRVSWHLPVCRFAFNGGDRVGFSILSFVLTTESQ